VAWGPVMERVAVWPLMPVLVEFHFVVEVMVSETFSSSPSFVPKIPPLSESSTVSPTLRVSCDPVPEVAVVCAVLVKFSVTGCAPAIAGSKLKVWPTWGLKRPVVSVLGSNEGLVAKGSAARMEA
jgi:hypothetical protein